MSCLQSTTSVNYNHTLFIVDQWTRPSLELNLRGISFYSEQAIVYNVNNNQYSWGVIAKIHHAGVSVWVCMCPVDAPGALFYG